MEGCGKTVEFVLVLWGILMSLLPFLIREPIPDGISPLFAYLFVFILAWGPIAAWRTLNWLTGRKST